MALKTVLVVDDKKSDREILANILRDEYIVLAAGDGETALSLLTDKKNNISAVLLDIYMPKANGFAVLNAIRSDRRTFDIPVIMITASDDSLQRRHAINSGANDFVKKPYKSDVIRHCLNNNITMHEAGATISAIRRDSLTGLLNREAFFEQAGIMIARRAPGYYIMACFDVNKFKVINDQYGTAKGDEVLKSLAQTFKEGFGAVGGICCRISADNFAVLYPFSYADSPENEELRRKAGKVEGIVTQLVFSVGRYTVNDLEMPPSAMFDRAMLAAESVKGRYDVKIGWYDESMHERLIYEQHMVLEMENALQSGQFEVWLQPQFNHSNGKIIGAEALARWSHPELGLIAPTVFVPVFEQNGFIYALDKYIWESTCRILREWLNQGKVFPAVSVNISRYDLFREDLMSVITGLLNKYQIPVDMLRLEITESAFAESTEQIVGVVRQLMDYGFTVEIDDFGSGYSSLNTLKDVPAQIIKLDMKFLEKAEDAGRGGSIIESVVRMAKWLGVSVIAEGVESVEHADFLRSIGCDLIQGFFYAKPMPLAAFEQFCDNVDTEMKQLNFDAVKNISDNLFWDPNSMDTLIFNSFVGSACIFEYYNGNVEMLRATQSYYKMINSEIGSTFDILKLKWNDYLEEGKVASLKAAIEKSAATHEEITDNYTFKNLPGNPGETVLRSGLRVIAAVEDRYLVYCISENITVQLKAEKKSLWLSEQLQAVLDNVDMGIVASIIDEEKIEFVFSNQKYYDILGYTKEQYLKEVKNPFETIYEEDRERVRNQVREVNRTRGTAASIYRAVRRDKSLIWIRSAMSTGQFMGFESTVQLAFFRDISNEVLTRQNEKKTTERLQMIMNDVSCGITAVTYENDREIYVFTNDKYYELFGHTRESYTNEVVSVYELIHPLDRQRVLEQASESYKNNTSITIEYRIITRDGQTKWLHGEITSTSLSGITENVHLCILTDITQRKENERKIKESTQLTSFFMDDIPGGYCRMIMQPNGIPAPQYVNRGLYEMLGAENKEGYGLYEGNALAGVYEEDLPEVKNLFARMCETKTAQSARYRLLTFSGEYRWFIVYGRATTSPEGDTILNVFYMDASEQLEREKHRNDLLDKLPYGTALYVYDDNKITISHLNRRYWELVGREPRDFKSLDLFSVVHPEDRNAILYEIRAATQQQREMSIDLRLLYGENGYRDFRVAGYSEKRIEGGYYIFAVFKPLAETYSVYQQVLPVVMNTIMNSTTDLSFAKDTDYRYVCASRAFLDMGGFDSERDIIGKTDYDLFEKSLADKYRADDERLLNGRKALIDMIEKIPTTDGMPHYSSTSKYLLHDASGEVVGIYGNGRDITEYRDSYEKLNLISESIPGGIATYECSRDKVKLLYVNDGFCKLFGCTREEYMNKALENPSNHIFDEDAERLGEYIRNQIEYGGFVDFDCRVHTEDGGYKWINLRSSVVDKRGDAIIANAIIQDITEQRELLEKLRQSRDENMLAVMLSGNTIGTYEIATRTLNLPKETAEHFEIPEVVGNMPEYAIERGVIAKESIEAYRDFFENIAKGKDNCLVYFREKLLNGWHWLQAKSALVYKSDGTPERAVIAFVDVTEQLEKETVYKKWQQSLDDRSNNSYTLYRCNLSKDTSFDTVEGSLLLADFSQLGNDFNTRASAYVQQYVYHEDREKYSKNINTEALISNYRLGKRSVSFEYRELLPDTDMRWLRLTVDLVEYPGTADIEAYLMYENINIEKLSELQTKELSETDPLTGVLNRATFASLVNSAIRDSRAGLRHALLMLDLDGFKQINDVFGHAAGDQALVDTADALRSILRHNDLLCRLGGDEFMIFLNDIPDDISAAHKAKQMCSVVRKTFSMEVSVSGSVGIAIAPQDGFEFEALYKKADAALYYVKGSGKDNYAVFREDMTEVHIERGKNTEAETQNVLPRVKKRRMLIISDNPNESKKLIREFDDEYVTELTKDGVSALVKLRHFGSTVSAVLLDSGITGIDYVAVLDKMKQTKELRNIPVIVISGDISHEKGLAAIRAGASDFVTKPIDIQLLKLRVRSSVSKAENERLRAQNSYLELRNDERMRYETALEGSGLVVIEYDWLRSAFIYSPSASHYIAGNFDNRKLWHIMLSDMVADTATVQQMQGLVHRVAQDRTQMTASITVELKTPNRVYHSFKMSVRKIVDEYKLTNKMIITFLDLEYKDEEAQNGQRQY